MNANYQFTHSGWEHRIAASIQFCTHSSTGNTKEDSSASSAMLFVASQSRTMLNWLPVQRPESAKAKSAQTGRTDSQCCSIVLSLPATLPASSRQHTNVGQKSKTQTFSPSARLSMAPITMTAIKPIAGNKISQSCPISDF